MRRRLTVWLTAAAVILVAPIAAGAQTPVATRVLVMPFVVEPDPPGPAASAASAWLGEAAAILIGDELQRLSVGAFGREERTAAFERLQLPQASNLTRAMTIRAGELLGASHVVFGEIKAGESQLAVHARLIRLETGEQTADVAADAPPNDLYALFDRVGAVLARSSGWPLGVETPALNRPPLDAMENYVKGLLALAPATQQRFLEAAARRAPRDARIALALWSAYEAQGLFGKALAVAQSVPADAPLARRAKFAAALTLIELKRLDEAYRDLSLLEGQRASPVLETALGVVQLRRGGQEGASAPAAYFTRAVQASPEDTDYLFNLGYAYAIAADAPAALHWLREAVRYDATDGDAHLVMSVVLRSSGKTAEAQHELDLARQLGTRRRAGIDASADKVPAGLERLRTDLDSGAVQPLAAISAPAQRDQQDTAGFYLEEGRRLFNARKDREAIDRLRRAIYFAPYEDEPHVLLGRLYERGGRLADAIEEFKVALWCRESAEVRVALGSALLMSGDAAGARREAERALVLQPGSADAKTLLNRSGR
jgi:tetratricopeptide (TPR) repeat protein